MRGRRKRRSSRRHLMQNSIKTRHSPQRTRSYTEEKHRGILRIKSVSSPQGTRKNSAHFTLISQWNVADGDLALWSSSVRLRVPCGEGVDLRVSTKRGVFSQS